MSEIEIPVWYEVELKKFKPNTKVKTDKGIVTIRKLIQESKEWESYHGSFADSLFYNFGYIEILSKSKIIRDNRPHPYDCEFASGRSCSCWCGEKYHGLMGIDAKIEHESN